MKRESRWWRGDGGKLMWKADGVPVAFDLMKVKKDMEHKLNCGREVFLSKKKKWKQYILPEKSWLEVISKEKKAQAKTKEHIIYKRIQCQAMQRRKPTAATILNGSQSIHPKSP